MIEPPAVSRLPLRRVTVPVGVLLAVVIGAFAWGLVMYALGHRRHGQGSATAGGEAAEVALGQLIRIDQALAHGQAQVARIQLGQFAPPPGSSWAAAAGLKQLEIADLERRELERAAASAALRLLDEHLHLLRSNGADLVDIAVLPTHPEEVVALAASREDGPLLLHSHDGGSHFEAVGVFRSRDAAGSPLALAPSSGGAQLMVLGIAAERCAWTTRDGTHFDAVHLPQRQGDLEPDGRCLVGGDGSLIAVLSSPSASQCWRSIDGGASWKGGVPLRSVAALIPTASGALIIGRSEGGTGLISSDGGASFHEPEAACRSALAGAAALRCLALAGGCLIADDHGGFLIDAQGRLQSQGIALPGKGRIDAAITHPQHPARWYALVGHALWRSEDAGMHWRAGNGRLSDLHVRCLAYSAADHARLLLAGDDLWTFDDEGAEQCFGVLPQP